MTDRAKQLRQQATFADGFLPPGPVSVSAGEARLLADLLEHSEEAKTAPICECPKCGRNHRSLQAGTPPSIISDQTSVAATRQWWQLLPEGYRDTTKAPFDGKPVLIARASKWSCEGRWRDDAQMWLDARDSITDNFGIAYRPTHWMPKPPPPAAS